MVTNRPPDHSGKDQSKQRSSGAAQPTHEQTYGGRIGDRIKETGRSIVGEQKARACEELETIGEVVHEAADKLHERDDHVVAEYVDSLADQIERVAEHVRRSNASDLIDQANDYARRHPEIVLGGAFVIGLAAARFFKASARSKATSTRHLGQQQYQQQRSAEPFRGGVAHSGSGFETRTSEAGPIAPTPRSTPGAAGGDSHGSQRSESFHDSSELRITPTPSRRAEKPFHEGRSPEDNR